jgi:predicted esterase
MRTAFLLSLILLGSACPTAIDDDDATSDDDDSAPPDDDDAAAAAPEAQGALACTNSAGRTGAFFLPERDGPIPIAVLFHPTGGDGASFLSGFTARAREDGFGIVAPDSRISPQGDATWEVGTDPGEVTPDLTFARTCLAEVLDRDDVASDGRLLAAGHSGGGSSAPYVASNDGRFTHFAVLHGGLFPGGLGPERPRGWLSTGEADTTRTPEELQGHTDDLAALGFDAELHLYPGGHGISEEERGALIGWWLADR